MTNPRIVRDVPKVGRSTLFLATGLTVPLFAFPALRIAGRNIDAATFMAAVFLILSIPLLLRSLREDPVKAIFAAAAGVVPLLVLLPPRHPTFSTGAYAASLGHWLLVSGFFLAAGTLTLLDEDRWRFLRANLAMGIAVAAFALYQVFGNARGWPGAGRRLLPTQWAPFRLQGYGSYPRPTSFFLEPGYMGDYLTWIALLAIVAAASPPRRGSQVLPIVAFASAVLGVAMSLSWGAYAELATMLLVAFLSARRLPREARARLRPFGGVLVGVVLVALMTPLSGALRERLARLSVTRLEGNAPAARNADSARVRVDNVRYSVSLFESEPLKGIGLGQLQIRGAAREGSLRESSWCGWAGAAALFGFLGPVLVAAGPLMLLRAWSWRPDVLAAGTVALAVVAQIHTASFIDLRWWFPLAAGVVLAAQGSRRPAEASRVAQGRG